MEKESNIQRASNRMKQTYKLASIMHHLVLTQINGEWVFKLNNLTQEERDYIHRLWCNGI